MRYIIDRFGGNTAICEDENRNFIEIEKSRLPDEAREGSIITIDTEGRIFLINDEDRMKRINEKMKSVWKK